MQKRVAVTVKGISPLLMHAYPMTPLVAFEKMPPEEQAEHACYRDPTNKMLYVPGVNIQRAMISAATYSKGKGRGSLQKSTAACVLISPDRVPLGVKDYVIDSRPVVMPATKGRVMRHRPRLDEWELKFTIEWDATLLKEQEVRKIIDDVGSRVGLLDFRPEKKGPFGRCIVTRWETLKR